LDALTFLSKWYHGWTGRFTYIAAAGLLAIGGPRTAALLPPVTIAVWFICLTWAALPGMRALRLREPTMYAGIFAGLFFLVLLSTTPNLFQSAFWKDGLINYSFPLIGMTLSIGLMLRAGLDHREEHAQIRMYTALLFLCAWFSGGFSEIYSTTQVAFYAMLIIASFFLLPQPDRRRMQLLFTAGLLGSLAAYAIVLLAPGNQIRQGLISAHPGLLRLVTFSLRNGLVIIAKFFFFTLQWAALSILAPSLAGVGYAQKSMAAHQTLQAQPTPLREQTWFKAVITLPAMAFILAVAACAPAVYMLNAYPDDRSILIPLYFIVAAVTVSSGLLGYGVAKSGKIYFKLDSEVVQRFSEKLILVLVLAGSVLSIFKIGTQFSNFRDYASRWDERHEQLSDLAAQGAREASAFGLENRFGISDLRVEADYWVNRCMADFYGFSSLTGK
jgi:hypothetical protein